jgi:hypothetical protein
MVPSSRLLSPRFTLALFVGEMVSFSCCTQSLVADHLFKLMSALRECALRIFTTVAVLSSGVLTTVGIWFVTPSENALAFDGPFLVSEALRLHLSGLTSYFDAVKVYVGACTVVYFSVCDLLWVITYLGSFWISLPKERLLLFTAPISLPYPELASFVIGRAYWCKFEDVDARPDTERLPAELSPTSTASGYSFAASTVLAGLTTMVWEACQLVCLRHLRQLVNRVCWVNEADRREKVWTTAIFTGNSWRCRSPG